MRFTITPLGSVGGRTVDQVVGDIVRYLSRSRPAVAPAQPGPATEAPSRYYADDGDEPGRWLGRGAKSTGLERDVDPDHFARVLAGRDPLTGERLITAQGSAGRRSTLGVGASTRWAADGEALYDEHDAAAALGVEADEMERLLDAGTKVAAAPSRHGQPGGSYVMSSADADGTRWVTETELTRVEAARAVGPTPDEIAAGGGDDDLLSLADAAGLAGVTARYLRGLARRWEQHRPEIEQAREEGRPIRRAYIVAWRGTKRQWLIKRSDLAEFVARRRSPAVRVGFDVTLTTEKSLGVLALLGDDATRATVLGAIEAGNDLALEWWEQHAAARVAGASVAAEGWSAASFRHLTSRALDPFPHHHNVIANAVTTADGARRALDARILYRHAVGASALATAEMRHRLSRDLGVRWRRSPSGGWELDGIPTEVLREFSRRRNEIEEALAELEEAIGRTSTIEELKNVVAETRPAKQQADPADLRADWWKRAESHGFSARELEHCISREAVVEPTREQIVGLLDRLAAVDGITAEGSVFTRGDVLAALTDAPVIDERGEAQPLLVGAARLEELADAFLTSRRAILLEPGEDRPRLRGLGDEPLYTTRAILQVQHRIADAFRRGLRAGSAVAINDVVDAAIQASSLSVEQSALVRSFCTSGHRLQCAIGRAGTGKTTAMRAAAAAWQASGFRVMGAAIKGEAARALGAAAGIPTETVAWYLAQSDPGRRPLDARTVLVVDEASTLGDADLDRLIQMAHTTGATIRLVGDPAQHGAVAAGGMFRVLCERYAAVTPELVENKRIQHPGDLAAVDALREGQIEQALAELEGAGHLHLAADDLQLYARLLGRWWESRQNGAPHPLVERSNHRRRQLNRLARRLLQTHGDVAVVELAASGGRAFAVGDEVIARRGSRSLHPDGDRRSYLRNGSRGVVAAIERGETEDGDVLVVDFADLGTIRIPRAFFDDHPGRDGRVDAGIDHSYAVTSYAVQGATFEESTGRVDERTSRAEVYVDLTRGRQANHLYATRAEDPLDGERLPKAPPPPLDAALAIRLRASGAEVTAWELDPSALSRSEADAPVRALA